MFVRIFLLLFFTSVVFVASAFSQPIPKRDFDPRFRPEYGVSYSFKQASWYGLDPQKSYIELLDEFKFDWIRLPFFWDQMVDENGSLKIEDLESAIEEAKKRNISVIVAIGIKTPYFPEYHLPKEIAKKIRFAELITANHPIAGDVLAIDRKVVERLASYDNIAYWQIENEPLIGNVNKWRIDPSLIAEEVKVVRETDFQKRPVILNHAAAGFYDTSWQKLLPILEKGDVFAVNAFFKTKGVDIFTAKILGHEIHILWPDRLVWPVHSWGIFSPNFERIKRKVEGNGNKLWVLEMQAEPYIKKLNEANDFLLSFKPSDIKSADQFLKSYKIESVGFWGAHFWQYRKTMDDLSWVGVVSAIVGEGN